MGNPASDTGTSFQTAFSSEGTHVVKVTDHNDNFASCTVQVSATACTQPSTITINSNTPTTWTLSGPTPQTQATAATQATYSSETFGGPYQFSPADLSGYTKAITPASSQSITTCGQALAFSVAYTLVPPPATTGGGTGGPATPATPTLTVSPKYAEVQKGQSASFSASYDPDGAESRPAQDVTLSANWSSSDPSVATFKGTGSGAASFLGNVAGSVTVTATYLGQTDTATLKVDALPPPSLSVLLTPHPDQGDAPLSTVLSAAVASQPYVDGTINYTFWLNCDYVGTSIAGATTKCGAPLVKYDAVNDNPKTAPATYSAPGNYHPMVIAEQGGYAAQSTAAVAAHTPITPPPPVTQTHFECVSNSCARVNGSGPNRCGRDADCGDGGTPGNPPSFGGVCDAVQHACVNKAGGSNTCSSDPACSGAAPTHLECQNQSCVIVGGVGSNTCAGVGSACNVTLPPPGPGGIPLCTFGAAPKLISKGQSSVLTWSCSNVVACTVSNDATGAIVKSAGISGSVSVSPAQSTVYDLNCDEGAFTTSTAVRVLSIIEVPPR